MTQALLTKVETFCASADKSAREPLAKALAGWRQRHAALLAENARVRAELVAEASAPAAPPELKAELDNMFKVRVPEKVDSDYNKMFHLPAARAGPARHSAAACRRACWTRASTTWRVPIRRSQLYLESRMRQSGKAGAATP